MSSRTSQLFLFVAIVSASGIAVLIGNQWLSKGHSTAAFVTGLESNSSAISQGEHIADRIPTTEQNLEDWRNELNRILLSPMGPLEKQILRSILSREISRNPDAVAEYIRQLPEELRDRILPFVSTVWVSIDFEKALAWVKTLDERGQNKALEAFREQFQNKGFEFCTTNISGLSGRARIKWISWIADSWVPSLLNATLNWVSGLSAEDHTVAVNAVVAKWAESDAPAAARYYESLASSANDQSVYRKLEAEWSKMDLDGALTWITNISVGEAQIFGIRHALEAAAEVKPLEVAQRISAMPAGELQNETAKEVVSVWAKRDPNAAAQWAMTFPPGDLQDHSLLAISRAWREEDSIGFNGWVETLKPGSGRDLVISDYVEQLQQRDPETAANFALQISEESERNRRLNNAFEELAKRDPMGARAWVRDSGLPNEVSLKLLGLLPTAPK